MFGDTEQVELQVLKATTLTRLGCFLQSMEISAELLGNIEAAPSRLLKARIFAMHANNEKHIGDKFKCLEHFHNAARLFEEEGHSRLAASAVANISNVLAENGDYVGALECRNDVFKHLQGIDCPEFRVLLLTNCIYDHIHLGEYDLAAESVARVAEILETIEVSPSNKICFLLAKAEVLNRQDHLDESLDCLKEAEDLNLQDKNKHFTGQILNWKGAAFSKMRNNSEARVLFENALEVFQKLALEHDCIEVKIQMGNHELRCRNYSTASVIFSEIYNVCTKNEQLGQLSRVLDGMIRCAKAQSEYKELARLLEEYQAHRGATENHRSKFQIVRQNYLLEISELQHQEEISRLKSIALKEKNEVLEKTNAQLVSIDRERREFMSLMAHDMRSPIASIVSYIDIIEEEGPLSEIMTGLKARSEDSLELAENILGLEGLENNSIAARLSKIDLKDFVSEIETLFSEKCRLKGQVLCIEETELYSDIVSDRILLKLVVNNLLTNAIKYSPLGSEISLRLKTAEQDQILIIEVLDEGAGVSEEKVGQLFTKFSDIGTEPTGGEGSHGLGLYLVSRYVDLLDGEISYRARRPKGSVFSATIPVGML